MASLGKREAERLVVQKAGGLLAQTPVAAGVVVCLVAVDLVGVAAAQAEGKEVGALAQEQVVVLAVGERRHWCNMCLRLQSRAPARRSCYAHRTAMSITNRLLWLLSLSCSFGGQHRHLPSRHKLSSPKLCRQSC